MFKKILIFLIILLEFWFFTNNNQIMAVSDTPVLFSVACSNGNTGDVITADIYMDTNTNAVGGIVVNLLYDSSVFSAQEVVVSNGFSSGDSNILTAGKVVFVWDTSDVGVLHSGILLTVKLKINDNVPKKDYTLTLTCAELYDATINLENIRYTITQGAVTVNSSVPSVMSSNSYNIGSSTISRIGSGTTVAQLLAGITGNQYITAYSDNTIVGADGLVGTGMVLKLMDGNETKQAVTAIVAGEVNGDGEINLVDFGKIKSHLLGFAQLNGAHLTAADVNNDMNITIIDLVKIKIHILNIAPIIPN